MKTNDLGIETLKTQTPPPWWSECCVCDSLLIQDDHISVIVIYCTQSRYNVDARNCLVNLS